MDDLLLAQGMYRTYQDPSGPIHAVRPTDLAIGRGEWVTIMGPSGSGKSTLLSLLGLLDRPSGGTYTIDGKDTAELSSRSRTGLRATTFGFVFQAFHLPAHRSVIDSVMMGSLYLGGTRRERVTKARDVIGRVGLADRGRTETRLLSGGQRQRVAVARALVGEPSVILCDEPTGNLDTTSADGVLELLAELCDGGVAIILVTHDHRVAERGQRLINIVDGYCHER